MIYLDNSATTKADEHLNGILAKYNNSIFFNPSAVYDKADDVRADILAATKSLADMLNCDSNELVFCSSGSECNNLAIFGATNPRSVTVTTESEHASVYNCFLELKQRGISVATAQIDKHGSIITDSLFKLITPATTFVSIMHVNNETSAINDVKQIIKKIRAVSPKCVVHCDGVQAFGKLKIDVKDIDCDMYTVSGHKLYAPKGIAALYVRKGTKIKPLIYGGGQQNGLRSGTENVAGIIAMGSICQNFDIEKESSHCRILNQRMRQMLPENLKPDYKFNSTTDGASHILSVSFKGIPAEVLIHSLEKQGIYISAGSACSAKKGLSRMLIAMRLPKDYAVGTVRISFAKYNTLNDIEKAAYLITQTVNKIYETFAK